MSFDLSNYSERDLKRLRELEKEIFSYDDFPRSLIKRFLPSLYLQRVEDVFQEWESITGSPHLGSLKDKSGNLVDWNEAKLYDNDWEVRRDAILSRNTSYEACLERAKHLARNGIEEHPQVQEALYKRLNENFTMASYAADQINEARKQGKAAIDDKTDSLIKAALQYSFEQTKLPENWQERIPNFSQLKIEAEPELDTSARDYVPDQSEEPSGLFPSFEDMLKDAQSRAEPQNSSRRQPDLQKQGNKPQSQTFEQGL